MIDSDLLIASRSTPIRQRELMSDLLELPLIGLYRYGDGGPPGRTDVVALPIPGSPPGETGWIVVTHADPEGEQWVATYSCGDEGWPTAFISGNAVAAAAADDQSGAYANLDPNRASEHRRADGLASQVASQAVGADIYITDREYLHVVTWDLARGVAVCRPEEALPLIGLYLRAQGEFRAASNLALNRGLYFWVGSRELLPAFWRWFAACVQHGVHAGGQELTKLGQSLLQRVARALEARDRIHVALSQPQHNDTREEVLAVLDDVLVGLMGAVDAAARVAHRVLGFEPELEYGAAWQKKSWLKRVTKASATLGRVTSPGTPGRDTLTILRLLRNSVHGTALQAMALRETGVREEQSLIGISSGESEIVEAMDRLGGRAAWGVRPLLPNRVHIDAACFVDTLFAHTLDLLNDLMDHTPVEQLSGVKLSAPDCRPPDAEPRNTGVWDDWVRTSIRWQLGL